MYIVIYVDLARRSGGGPMGCSFYSSGPGGGSCNRVCFNGLPTIVVVLFMLCTDRVHLPRMLLLSLFSCVVYGRRGAKIDFRELIWLRLE